MEDWKDDVEIFGKVESFVFSWKYVSSFGRRVGLSCASELLELQLECFVHECFQWKGIQHFVSWLRRLRFELFFGLSRAQVLVSKCALTFDRVKCRRTGNQQFFPSPFTFFKELLPSLFRYFCQIVCLSDEFQMCNQWNKCWINSSMEWQSFFTNNKYFLNHFFNIIRFPYNNNVVWFFRIVFFKY